MRRRRVWAVTGGVVGAGVLAAAGLYLYFGYVPSPTPPALDTEVLEGRVTVGGRARTYTAVVPQNLPAGAPLLFVFHGSLQNGQGIREATGYGFDRLADEHNFAVVYPDGYRGNWHDCRTAADYPARTENIDDNGMIRALIARFRQDRRVDTSRVFAVGYSNGGQMVYRIAAEMAGDFAGVAAVAATQPTADNFSCRASGDPLPVLIVNGTRDPIVPYDGGVISLFGFQPRGRALSAGDTARHFARINGVTAEPTERTLPRTPASGRSGRTYVTVSSYAQEGRQPVVQYTVVGGGHVVPGPDAAFPRLAGPIDRDFDAAATIWQFFAQLPAAATR